MRLRWLLEPIRDAVDEHVNGFAVHRRAAVHISAQKLGKDASDAARAENALLQFGGVCEPAMATQPVGDHPGVHRPYRSVVVRASPEPGCAGRFGPYPGAG